MLSGALLFLSASLILPGLISMLQPNTGRHWLVAETIDARNHLRAVNGMIVAVGLIALWSCIYLSNARQLVIALGVLMICLVAARLYSIVLDGVPGQMTWIYLLVELALGVLFLGWPPPK